MKTRPIVPAVLGPHPQGLEGIPYAPLFGDVYHSAAGALEQARAVFLAGNGLPARWAGRERFVILETGFGLGNNFLATWDAWRGDPQRGERLIFVSIEKHPLRPDDLVRVLAGHTLPDLAEQLVAAWPPLTPGLHTLAFEDGQVQLLLGFGDAAELLPALLVEADAFYLDGFAPARNPDMWSAEVLKRLGRLAAPGATAATWSVARALHDGLHAAGFAPEKVPGFGGKREMTRARFAPRHVPPPPAGGLLRSARHGDSRHALVIGAGLAGCAAAWALAEQGWRSTVVDARVEPAQEGSGNPAGMFHGIVNGEDGIHARAHRAAALALAATLRRWVGQRRVAGSCEGLLRLEPRMADEDATALLYRLGLPAEFVRWMSAREAREASALPVGSGGWWFAGGGWVSPAGLARLMLEVSGAGFIGGTPVATLRRAGDGHWQALDADGRVIAAAPVVVLAAAAQSRALLAPFGADADLPLSRVRGQISILPAGTPGLAAPRAPVAGAGYALPPHDGRIVFGATSQHHDDDARVRDADHRHNLAQAARLGVWTGSDTGAGPSHDASPTDTALPGGLAGRVGWRAVTPDRLPLVGALPGLASQPAATDTHPPPPAEHPAQAAPSRNRLDQPRLIPRLRDAGGGLYMLTGLGSRGITWSVLAGRLLASWVSGSPCPVEADLRDALDPARFVARRARRQADDPDEAAPPSDPTADDA